VSRSAADRASFAARPTVLIRGAGDLATGVAVRFVRSGFPVAMTEIEEPTVVRRTVAFAEAMYRGTFRVEGIEGVRVVDRRLIPALLRRRAVPVILDPAGDVRTELRPAVLVDAIMAKRNLGTRMDHAPLVVALGPGFVAGLDAHAVIETKRGHSLGRVITGGEALPNTGCPGDVGGFTEERLLRAPVAGVFRGAHHIGDLVRRHEVVGHVGDVPVCSRLDGLVRGLLHSGLTVEQGAKLGDVDARAEREDCFLVSDKALAIGGGVLEAVCAFLAGVGPGQVAPGGAAASAAQRKAGSRSS
jgi:xanthine dehydrogenase accessory factor